MEEDLTQAWRTVLHGVGQARARIPPACWHLLVKQDILFMSHSTTTQQAGEATVRSKEDTCSPDEGYKHGPSAPQVSQPFQL